MHSLPNVRHNAARASAIAAVNWMTCRFADESPPIRNPGGAAAFLIRESKSPLLIARRGISGVESLRCAKMEGRRCEPNSHFHFS
jgi:hypothetical protein